LDWMFNLFRKRKKKARKRSKGRGMRPRKCFEREVSTETSSREGFSIARA